VAGVSGGISLVDVLVLRRAGTGLECLLLRRGAGGRSPGSWEMVHGHVEPGELPKEAALRELGEETGLAPLGMYNLSRVESFYLHKRDAVALVAMFAAFVDRTAVQLSGEHDDFVWLPPDEARRRFSWPREVRCLDDALHLIGSGDAGPLEDVLRIC
jgi:8-oxo-dGTP pyrophosphatase MutT (NUDIX family)